MTSQANSNDMSAILQEQASRLFQQYVTKDSLSAVDDGEWPAALWQEMERAGLPLALVTEAAGGVGVPAADALRLLRLSGYHTLPLPLGETMLAASFWTEAGGALPEGSLSLAPGEVALTKAANGYTITGTLRRVPWGARADHVLLVARDAAGQAHLVLLPKGLAVIEARRNVAYEPRDTLSFNGVTLPAEAVRPAPAAMQADGLLGFGALLRVQQMVGAMERVLDHALTYANERVQFGRPIAKFQAVQHMLAVAAGQYAAAAAAADAAIEAYASAEFEFAVAVAKARVGEAAGEVAAIGHQVHAAMGFTQEHPLHFATRRLWSWRDEFGAEAFWQERLGRLICAQGGEALWPMLTSNKN